MESLTTQLKTGRLETQEEPSELPELQSRAEGEPAGDPLLQTSCCLLCELLWASLDLGVPKYS